MMKLLKPIDLGKSKSKNPNAKANNADSLKANPQTLSFQIHGNQLLQETQFTADENDETARQIGTQNNFTQTIKMSEMERHIFNKALHIKGKIVNLYFISIACKANSTFKIAMNCKITC